MSVVYLARQTDLDRLVALKELAPQLVTDAAFGERFVRESRMAGSLSHPNIVTVHDFIEHEGVPYIAMEYLERGSLRPFIDRMTLAQIAGVLEGLLSGLEHAEGRGIVHRDLKPENVMVTNEGKVKIADYGIAKALNQAAGPTQLLTGTGMAIGTPTYMAPEQAMAKEIGPAADLYSTGIIAYELMVGHVPFHDADTPMQIMWRQVHDRLPLPQSVDENLDPQLVSWLEWLLEKEPSARPSGAEEAWDRLEEIVIRLLGPRWRRQSRLLDERAQPNVAKGLAPTVLEPTREDAEPPAALVDSAQPVGVEQHPATYAPADAATTTAALSSDAAVAEVADGLVAPLADSPAAGTPLLPEPQLARGDEYPTEPAPESSSRESAVAYAPTTADSPVDSVGQAPSAAPVTAPIQEASPPDRDPTAAGAPLPTPIAPLPGPTLPDVPEAEPPELAATIPAAVGGKTSDRRRLKRVVAGGAVLGLLGVAGVVGVILVGGGSEPKAAPGTSTTAPLPREPQPSPSERVALDVTGDSVYAAAPRGHVVRLSAGRLKTLATASDPATPRGVAAAEDGVYVADDETITKLSSADLAPLSVLDFRGPSRIVAGPGVTAAITQATAKGAGVAGEPRGRSLCIVTDVRSVLRAKPCVGLRYEPTGAGVTRSGRVFVANGKSGTVVPYTLAGGTLRAGNPIRVGAGAAGRMVEFLDRLYVPVKGGVAVVDLSSLKPLRTISLPGTPSDIWIVAANGRLFAALYSRGQVAVLDTSSPDTPPRLVRVGRHPVALAGSAEGSGPVYVAAAGRIERLDPRTGRRRGSTRLPSLTTIAVPLTARPPTYATQGRTVTVTIPFSGGKLDPPSLDLSDKAIRDGTASVNIWQGGIKNQAGPAKRRAGLKVATASRPGRLTVTLSSAPGAFDSLTGTVGSDRRSIVLSLVARPPSTQTTTPRTTTPRTTTPPKRTPPPPKTTTTTPNVTVG